MNAVTRKAREILAEITTIASAISDKKITIQEIVALKYKGLTKSVNLAAYFPENNLEIKEFSELSSEEKAYISNEVAIDEAIIEHAYNSALFYYKGIEAVGGLVPSEEEPTTETSPTAPQTDNDELVSIKGLGEKAVALLKEHSITTKQQLLNMGKEEIAKILKKKRGFAPVISKLDAILAELSK